jgi:hypothetical protein
VPEVVYHGELVGVQVSILNGNLPVEAAKPFLTGFRPATG